MSTASHRPVLARTALAALAALPLACGFNTHGDVPSGEGGSTSTSTTTSTGDGGATTFCEPGKSSACYTGPNGTLGVGICKAGTKVCNADGTQFGPCVDEVKPAAADDCATMLDENCDGTPNEVCQCEPGTTQACYAGAPGTAGVGPCKEGTQTCNANGVGYGPCTGEVTPLPEDCTTAVDEDCNGKAFDDTDNGCVCDPASMPAPCYSGPAGTMGMGVCVGGTVTCNADGKGTSGCVGEVTPSPEDCTTAADEDCDGKAFDDDNDGCVCQPGTSMSCNTNMMGVCAAGSQQCSADGKSYAACAPNTPPSTEDCNTTSTDENCDGDSTCNGGAIVGKLKGAAGKEDFAYGVAVDFAGNFTAGGIIDGTFDTNGALTAGSAWLGKYNAAGGGVWEKTFPPTGTGAYALVSSVAVDGAGSVFAGGEFKGTLPVGGNTLMSDNNGGGVDAFLMKLDGNGNVLWVKGFGGNGAQAIAGVTVDNAGNVFIAGGMAGTADFGGGVLTANGLSTDAFVAKLDNNGTHVWSKISGDSGFQYALGVAATPGGDVMAVGTFSNHLNFGTDMDAGGDRDVFVVRLQGNNGSEVWARRYGDNSDQTAFAVAVDAQSNAVVTGSFFGNIDFGNGNVASDVGDDVFVVKLAAANGAHIWSKGFGGADDQAGYGVAVDGLGNVVVTGSFETSINFGGVNFVNPSTTADDLFVAKLKGSDGSHIWSKAFGDGNASQFGYEVAVDKLGSIVVAGGFRGSADFGAPVGTLTSAGGLDIFAVKLKP